jgi:hypothetical protein
VTNRGTTLRPDVVSHAYYQGQSRARYFNLGAFSPTPIGAGHFGNAGVGILQGPGTATVSLGMAKVFDLHERLKLGFESSFTNVLNHTNFAPPATQIDNAATFGVLSARRPRRTLAIARGRWHCESTSKALCSNRAARLRLRRLGGSAIVEHTRIRVSCSPKPTIYPVSTSPIGWSTTTGWQTCRTSVFLEA